VNRPAILGGSIVHPRPDLAVALPRSRQRSSQGSGGGALCRSPEFYRARQYARRETVLAGEMITAVLAAPGTGGARIT
jgi:hypothetical protein